MKKQIAFLSIILVLSCFCTSVWATQYLQLDAMTVEDKKIFDRLKKTYSNSQLHPPVFARLQYQDKMAEMKRLSDKKEALKFLSDHFNYEPEELERLSQKLDTEPLFQYPLNPDNEKEMLELLEKDTPTALALITMAGSFNPVYLPSDEQDESLLDKPQTAMQSNDSTVGGQQSSTYPSVSIPSVRTVQPTINVKKRLGQKSYRIHPNNFSYEKN